MVVTRTARDQEQIAEERRKAESSGQGHLFAFWDQLTHRQQDTLLGEIMLANCDRIRSRYESAVQKSNWAELARRAEPPKAVRLDSCATQFSAADAKAAGERALREGRVGAILVAGGQGTRLGFNHPKGMYAIGPVSGVTLFQILFEKILAAGRRYGVEIPLYVMTSDATHVETEDYLKEQHNFGLRPESVRLFCQGVMPAVDAATGKILLADKGRVALSPDGHGGMLAALERSGGLTDIERRGIEHLFYFQVDNPLVRVCDPIFLGYHILSRSEMTTLAIAKREPRERVGNVVQIDGRTQVIEYSDFPDDVAAQRNEDGSLRFWAGSIAIHVFDAAFLRRASGSQASLPFHVARKKVPFVDERGQRVEPAQPNALKFERFIFDLMPLAERPLVVQGDPARVFAPVKNPPGDPCDSASTCRTAMVNLHRDWLGSAGAKIAENVPVEISPLFALDSDEVRAKIKPGMAIGKPTYLR
jgi:UDP-N-acetylglucosamine/UDP-N-acetylgalactosamine diphosphorylase